MWNMDPANPMTWGILDVASTELVAWMSTYTYGAVAFSIFNGGTLVGRGMVT